ncbi:MAG: aldehyde oxidoreductase, partial [Lachnospiraceae bacterium]|nr:aldehyde oxidoreductase [Lachnospiraceae bacterium]
HKNIIACGVPQVQDIPDDIRVEFLETPRGATGAFGSAGCSEVFQSSQHMAVINAIDDAIGCRIYELPATPDKVKAALAAKAEGKELKPAKYFLGSELEDELDEIQAHPM